MASNKVAIAHNFPVNDLDDLLVTPGTSEEKIPWMKADDGIPQYQRFIK